MGAGRLLHVSVHRVLPRIDLGIGARLERRLLILGLLNPFVCFGFEFIPSLLDTGASIRDGGFALDHVGNIEIGARSSSDESLVRFEGGPVIESVSVDEESEGHWAVMIDWLASGSVEGQIFVHVRDADGNLVMQADGPALGGMIPPWLWHAGDRIHDIRHILVEGPPPYTVEVGLFDPDGRIPAYRDGVRCPEEAPLVATIDPRPLAGWER